MILAPPFCLFASAGRRRTLSLSGWATREITKDYRRLPKITESWIFNRLPARKLYRFFTFSFPILIFSGW